MDIWVEKNMFYVLLIFPIDDEKKITTLSETRFHKYTSTRVFLFPTLFHKSMLRIAHKFKLFITDYNTPAKVTTVTIIMIISSLLRNYVYVILKTLKRDELYE